MSAYVEALEVIFPGRRIMRVIAVHSRPKTHST